MGYPAKAAWDAKRQSYAHTVDPDFKGGDQDYYRMEEGSGGGRNWNVQRFEIESRERPTAKGIEERPPLARTEPGLGPTSPRNVTGAEVYSNKQMPSSERFWNEVS